MTDENDNGAGSPAPADGGEQLELALAGDIAGAASELLALLGVPTSVSELLEGARTQLQVQQQLLAQVLPTFRGTAAKQLPLFGLVGEAAGASPLLLAGAPPNASFTIAGPKQLRPGQPAGPILSSLSALAFLFNPAMRLVAHRLGLALNFQQLGAKPPRPLARG